MENRQEFIFVIFGQTFFKKKAAFDFEKQGGKMLSESLPIEQATQLLDLEPGERRNHIAKRFWEKRQFVRILDEVFGFIWEFDGRCRHHSGYVGEFVV